MEKSIKEEVASRIAQLSEACDIEKLNRCNAQDLSSQLNVSRNLISHYLNQLFSEEQLIKINTRPVLYADPKKLSEDSSIKLKPVYSSFEELQTDIKRQQKGNDTSVFEQLIGYQDSLKMCVEQCKSAISYPGSGLPFLLYGQTGTGKSYIAQLCFEYCKAKQLVDKRAEFVTVNCAEYANNPELFLINLFGYRKGAYTGADKDRQGLLAIANKGVLFLDEIHALTPECQEKIFLFMDKGIYHAVGDNETWLSSQVHLIFATTEEPTHALLRTLLRRIPIVIDIPPLSDRFMHEKKELLQVMVAMESQNISKPIDLSEAAYFAFLDHEYVGNVGEMKNAIRVSIAKANYRENGGKIQVHLYDLPSGMIEKATSNVQLIEYDDYKMMDLLSYEREKTNESKLEQFNQAVLHIYEKNSNFEHFQLAFQSYMDQYNNYLLFEHHLQQQRQDNLIESLVENIYRIAAEKFNLEIISNTQVVTISRFLSDYTLHYNRCWQILEEHRSQVNDLLQCIKSRFPVNYSAILNISRLLQNSLNVQIDELGLLDLLLYMIYYDSQINTSQIPVLIIAHGYNIASSIADFANQLLKQKIFSAIDMPIECGVDVIISKVSQYLKHLEGCKEILLMVDMGSLEEIYKYTGNLKNIDVGIINNVTTKLALDIGGMIMEGETIEMILEEAAQRNQHKYMVLRNAQKQDAILCVCQSGFGTADKIKRLIEASLPKGISIPVLTYEYEHADKLLINSLLCQKYNILFIAGTIDPNISDAAFISVEEIIDNHHMEKLTAYMRTIMKEEEIEQFNQNIIRNFSLDNLMKYLTILNPEIIISNVEEILNDIEKKLGLDFQGKTKVGLYMHISCLIERLIINKSGIVYDHIETFIENHGPFIETVQKSFQKLEKIYNVQIPMEEIGHLYDYICLDSVQNESNSVKNQDCLYTD